ncbi:MAG: hypothetical protein U0K90_06415 [Bacteroidales bacterium]|nr:hypothetical protein [Bacteroidales bacterium]
MKFSDTLHLILKDKWFQMYKDGLKTEEYREITPYWCNRLLGPIPLGLDFWKIELDKNSPIKKYNAFALNHFLIKKFGLRGFMFVTFHRGYTNEKITFLLNNIKIDYGDMNLGAPDSLCFIIQCGDFVSYIDKKL